MAISLRVVNSTAGPKRVRRKIHSEEGMYPPDVGDRQRSYKLYPDVTGFDVHAPSSGLEGETNLSTLDSHMSPQPLGLISDTHGLLRPQAVEALCGCAHIIHAGDIGRYGDH